MNDLFLSDVHVENQSCQSDVDQNTFKTQIEFLVVPAATAHRQLDEDGDLVVSRPFKCAITLEHSMMTSLDLVGRFSFSPGVFSQTRVHFSSLPFEAGSYGKAPSTFATICCTTRSRLPVSNASIWAAVAV
jgi:hypothetical protein